MKTHSLWFLFWVATAQEDGDDDDVGLLQANLRQLSVDKLTHNTLDSEGGSCSAWLQDNTCPFGAEAASEKSGSSREECCDVDKFEKDCKAAAAKTDSDNEKMIAEAKEEAVETAKAAGEDITEAVEPDPVDDRESGEKVDVDEEEDEVFQKKVKEIDDKVVKCLEGTMKQIANRSAEGMRQGALAIDKVIDAEVELEMKKQGLLDDADDVLNKMNQDDAKNDVDKFIVGEMEDDAAELQMDADDDDDKASLLEVVKRKALGNTGLKIDIDKAKMSELEATMKTSLEMCKASDEEKAEIKEIMSHLKDPVKLRTKAEAAGVDMDSKAEVDAYIEDVKKEYQKRVQTLLAAEQSVEKKCRDSVSKLDLDVFDSVWLKHHGGDCSKLLLQQLQQPKHRKRAAEKFRQAAEMAFIFQGDVVDMLKMRNGVSLHSLTATQHLRSRMLPKDGKACSNVRDTLNRDSHRHLADDEDTQSYVDCLCVDQHHHTLCHLHHAHVLRQMQKAHVKAGMMEAKRLAIKGREEQQAISSASSDDNDDAEIEDADEIQNTQGKVGIGPCILEPFFSGKICFQGFCAESPGSFASKGDRMRNQYAQQSKHLKAMKVWSGRKSVFDQAKAALDYLGGRQGSGDSTIDTGLDCFDISATLCVGLQPGEKLVFKATIGWQIPGSCFKGLKSLIENNIYLTFQVCLGTPFGFIKGVLSMFGLDCFTLFTIRVYLTLNMVAVEVGKEIGPVKGKITGSAGVGPLASSLVSDYCYSINGGKRTCNRRKCNQVRVCNAIRIFWSVINICTMKNGNSCHTEYYRCAGNQGGYNNCIQGYNDKRKPQIQFKKELWVPWIRYNRRRRWLGSVSAGGSWKTTWSHTIKA